MRRRIGCARSGRGRWTFVKDFDDLVNVVDVAGAVAFGGIRYVRALGLRSPIVIGVGKVEILVVVHRYYRSFRRTKASFLWRLTSGAAKAGGREKSYIKPCFPSIGFPAGAASRRENRTGRRDRQSDFVAGNLSAAAHTKMQFQQISHRRSRKPRGIRVD